MTFAALLTAVGCARLFIKYTLQNWSIDREHIETAELLVSELVTNAVKSTGLIESRPRYTALDHLALVHVRLLLFERSIVLEVWDSDPHHPIVKEPTLDAEGGRGLFLIESMSLQWNYYHPRAGGKVVWCELDVRAQPAIEETAESPVILPSLNGIPAQPTRPKS